MCGNWLKIVNFARAIARIRMRPLQLTSGEKYCMLHGRKVDFTSCHFAAHAKRRQQNCSVWKSLTFLSRSIIYYLCSFRTSYHGYLFSKNSKSHKITNRASIVMKIVTIKGLWLLHWRTKFHIDISSRLCVIGVSNVENRTHTHTRTHKHTSGYQQKITFLDVLDYCEYSDTNISKKQTFTKTWLSQWGSKSGYSFFEKKNIYIYMFVHCFFIFFGRMQIKFLSLFDELRLTFV